MPTHAEQKILPYTSQQLYDLVLDVEKYPQFLPWCTSCRITRRQQDCFYADLVIGYKMIREKFASKVITEKPMEIRVEYLSGPLKSLSNRWRFIEGQNGSCTIDFYVDFEFKNVFLQRIMNVFFDEIVRRMVGAFEARARDLYATHPAE